MGLFGISEAFRAVTADSNLPGPLKRASEILSTVKQAVSGEL